MQVRLWTRVWEFCFVRHLVSEDGIPLVGECDPNRSTIQVVRELKGQFKLDTCLHEMLHAVLPEKDELWVNSVASDMAQVLWEIGYRNAHEAKSAKQSQKTSKK